MVNKEHDEDANRIKLLIVRSCEDGGDACGKEMTDGTLCCSDPACERPCFQMRQRLAELDKEMTQKDDIL